jgi:hypothetical protein
MRCRGTIFPETYGTCPGGPNPRTGGDNRRILSDHHAVWLPSLASLLTFTTVSPAELGIPGIVQVH